MDGLIQSNTDPDARGASDPPQGCSPAHKTTFWYFTRSGKRQQHSAHPEECIPSRAGRGGRLGWEGLPCWQVGPVHPSEQRQRPLTWLQEALLKQWQVWLQSWPYLFSWHAAGEQSRQEWWALGGNYSSQAPTNHPRGWERT